jgi:hypothetical protein
MDTTFPKISENYIFTIDFSDLVQKNAKVQLCRSQPRENFADFKKIRRIILPKF